MPTVSASKALRLARNIAYPQQAWWFMASFIGLVSLLHFTNVLVLRYRKNVLTHRSAADTENTGNSIQRSSFRKLVSTVREIIAIVLYRYTVPLGYSHRVNVTEIAIVVAYITSVLIWTFINCYSSDSGLKFDPLFYANRAGNIATSQVPLLILLSGKNNLISIITGISFEKLHIFHRAIGRALVILILIHTGGRLKLGLDPDEASTVWLKVGYATLAGWILLLFMFFRPVRARFYNIFMTAHIILSILILVTMYYHVGGVGYSTYLIPAFFFWGFDRFLRLVRTVWNNRGLAPSPIKGEIVSPNLIRLTVHQWMSWKAGQAVYITIPKISMMPFEAHPFTMANIPTDEKNKPNELVFLIKVKNGFTNRLYHAILNAQEKGEEFRFNAFIDGPYGSPPDLDTFSDIVIITGGSGLSFGLPLLQEIVRRVETKQSFCRSVLLVWTIPVSDPYTCTWIIDCFDKILKDAPSSLRIRIQIYTNTDGRVPSTHSLIEGGEKDSPGSKPTTPDDTEKFPATSLGKGGIIINSGRLDIKSLLEEELSSVADELSVNVAGPPSMVEDVRSALRFNLNISKLVGQPRVHLHTEPYEIA